MLKKNESQVTDDNPQILSGIDPKSYDDHFISLCMMELFIIVLLKQKKTTLCKFGKSK
jgi:hypothetical protein